MSLRGEEPIEFGAGHFIGPAYGDERFVELYDNPENPDIVMQAEAAGYANGCPVAQELISTDRGRGAEAMLNRYASVNFWFVHITEVALEHDENLYYQLTAPVPRRVDEPVGKFEPESVPPENEDEMAPMGTLYGWALPRLLIKQIGEGTAAETAGRMTKGLSILEQAMDGADDPIHLLARFAEGIAQAGDVPPVEVLQGTLSAGWLKEHNATSMINELKTDIYSHAVAAAALSPGTPTLWDTYSSLDEVERTRLGII